MASAPDFEIARNDTRPKLVKQLLDATGSPVSLVGVIGIVFNMRRGTATKVSRATAAVSTVDDTGATVAATAGWAAYTWAASDTNTVGTYEGEFEVTFADGGIQTIPNPRKIRIEITGDIA